MKLSDFSDLTEWISGSGMNLMATGTYRGQQYQVKIHAAAPKWNNTAAAIEKKKAELRACGEGDKERIERELRSLESSKERNDKRDRDADNYLKLRNDLIKAVRGAGTPLLVPPIEAWKEPIEFKNNVTFMVEATPWLKQVCWFSPDKPVCFGRDLTENQQYDLVASLADSLAKLHKAGVLHGDLKIGNTVIVEQDGKQQVAIIDYDGAILLKDLWSKKYSMDVWHYALAGTFFSPEHQQLMEIVSSEEEEEFEDFDFDSITEKSDIFSLAFTIYEYFYGELGNGDYVPFESPTGEKLDSDEYGLAVAQDYRPKFTEDPNEMSDLLYAALNWMLAKSPADRPSAEQVRDIFKNRDLEAIPKQYRRIDPHLPWESDNIEFLPLPEGVEIRKVMSKEGRYFLRERGTTKTRLAADLIRDGYAKKIGEEAPAPDVREFWPSDATGEMPPCVKRASADGRYILSYINIFNAVATEECSYRQLVDKGVVCTDAEMLTPWPQDKGMSYITSSRVLRDMTKGPGFYIVRSIPSQRLSAEQMYSRNYAAKRVTFSLNGQDVGAYEIVPDIPSEVESITRDAIRGYGYRIKYRDGRVEKVLIDGLLAKGFVVKK